jgi:uncharacterized protein (DUF1330 family)
MLLSATKAPPGMTMKAYLVLDFSIGDLRGFLPYVDAIPAFIEKHGGRYVVRGVEPTIMEGDWTPERIVILEFPSRGDATAFLEDPDAQPLFAVRHKTTNSKLILVEGCT